MTKPLNIELEIPPLWDTINSIRSKIAQDKRITIHGEDLINATLMVASELLENAVKYGYHNDTAQGVNFNLHVEDNLIAIEVLNAVAPEFDIKVVSEKIDGIKNSNDPAALYTDKLLEIASNPKKGESGLGLLRIAYEGEFSLDYEFNNGLLSIKAKRKL